MALRSIGRGEKPAACANGQALLLFDMSPILQVCGKNLPTAHRLFGARAISNEEMTLQNAEMQRS